MTQRFLFGLLIGLVGILIALMITYTDNDNVTLMNVECVDYEPIPETNYTNVTFIDRETEEEYHLVIFTVYTYNYAYLKRDVSYNLTYEEKKFWKPDNLIHEIKKVGEM